MIPFIDKDAERHLDWLTLTDAMAAGHELPRAEIGDTFLYRGSDTLLSRAAWIDGLGSLVKSCTIFPDNRAAPPINGSVTLFSDADGTPSAFLDFHLVTKWKTVGDSLLAARRLARPESERILIVGSGTVAAGLREAYAAAFPASRFTVWSRNPANAAAFADRHNTDAAIDLAGAVGEADIVTCATMATDPVIRGDWLRPGQHLDLIGAYRPDMREADDAALRRARIFVDSRDTVLGHIGELKIPLETGAIAPGDVLADHYEPNAFTRAPDDITLFKNGGGAHLDLMVAHHILATVGEGPARG